MYGLTGFSPRGPTYPAGGFLDTGSLNAWLDQQAANPAPTRVIDGQLYVLSGDKYIPAPSQHLEAPSIEVKPPPQTLPIPGTIEAMGDIVGGTARWAAGMPERLMRSAEGMSQVGGYDSEGFDASPVAELGLTMMAGGRRPAGSIGSGGIPSRAASLGRRGPGVMRMPTKTEMTTLSDDVVELPSAGIGHNMPPPGLGIDDELASTLTSWKKTKGGDYQGAPAGIDTPEKAEQLAQKLAADAITPAGRAGRGFYSEHQDELRSLTPSAETAQKWALAYGLTSNNAPVDANMLYANTALNQMTVGEPVKAGMFANQSGEQIEQVLESGDVLLPPSLKAGPYAYASLPHEFRPYIPGPQRGVWDRHMATAAGYPGENALSPTQHRFMDAIGNRAIRILNADEREIAMYGAQPYNTETMQEQVWGNERALKGLEGYGTTGDMMKGSMSFTQAAAIPGPSTGVDDALLNAPLSTKGVYTDAMFDAIGADTIPQILGMGKQVERGFGPWRGHMEPNRVIGQMTGRVGAQPNAKVDPASQDVANTMTDWVQLALGQEGAGLTTPTPLTAGKGGKLSGEKLKAANIAAIPSDILKGGSEQAYQHVYDVVGKTFGEGWADRVNVMPFQNGLTLKNIGGMPGEKFRYLSGEVSKQLAGKEPTWMTDATMAGRDYTYVDWSKGEYKQLLDRTIGNPNLRKLFDANMPQLVGRAQKAHLEMAKQFGFRTDTMLDKFRTILSNEGIEGLTRAMKKGILPGGSLALVLALSPEVANQAKQSPGGAL